MGTLYMYVLNSHPNNRKNAHFSKIGDYFSLVTHMSVLRCGLKIQPESKFGPF